MHQVLSSGASKKLFCTGSTAVSMQLHTTPSVAPSTSLKDAWLIVPLANPSVPVLVAPSFAACSIAAQYARIQSCMCCMSVSKFPDAASTPCSACRPKDGITMPSSHSTAGSNPGSTACIACSRGTIQVAGGRAAGPISASATSACTQWRVAGAQFHGSCARRAWQDAIQAGEGVRRSSAAHASRQERSEGERAASYGSSACSSEEGKQERQRQFLTLLDKLPKMGKEHTAGSVATK